MMNRPYREINVPTMPSLIIVNVLSIIVRKLDLKTCNIVLYVSVATVLLYEYF